MQATLFDDAPPNGINPQEAPPGYYAVLKSDVASDALGNICRACDWRPECSGGTYRCMPYELANSLKRLDGCSVVFKRTTTHTQPEHCLRAKG